MSVRAGLGLCIAIASGVLNACASPPVLAPTNLTPQQLLTRNRRVDDAPLPGMYHLRYRRVASDGEVSISDFYEAPGRAGTDYRAIMSSRGIRVERGRIFGRSWQRDVNGLVLPDSQLKSAFDRVLAAALHRADARVRIAGITQSPPRRYVLEIRPNARIVQRLYFDVKTFLLRRIVTQDYDRRVGEIDYDGYAWLGKRPVPSRESDFDNLSNKTYETTLVEHERIPYQAKLLSIPRSRVPFAVQYPLPSTINSLFGASGILIRVDIKGSPYWLKLDSGATDIVLDRALVARLGLHEFWKSTGTKGGRVEASTAILPRIDVGPVYAKNVVVTAFASDDMEQGVEVVGLLGCDFIASRPLAIDFRKETVSVTSGAPQLTQPGWVNVRTPLHECRPSIGVRLDRQPATLLLDFGAQSTLVNEDVFDRFGRALRPLDTTPVRFIGGEALDGTQYVVPSASAGNLDLGPIVATVVAGGRGQDLDDDGALGRNVLKDYRVVLDYRRQVTYFHRYQAPAADDP